MSLYHKLNVKSILISSPNTLALFVVSFVNYYYYNEISPHPDSHPLIHTIITTNSLFDCFSALSHNCDDSQWYPMHMKRNGSSKTLIRLFDGVHPISDHIYSKLCCRRQQSNLFLLYRHQNGLSPPHGCTTSPSYYPTYHCLFLVGCCVCHHRMAAVHQII